MKRFFMLLLVVGVFASHAWARSVQQDEVFAAAESLLIEPLLRKTLPNTTIRSVEEMDGFWCVHLVPQGHLLLSGSTKVTPLLGYSAHNYVVPSEEHPSAQMERGMRQQIRAAEWGEVALASTRIASAQETLSEAEERWNELLCPPQVMLFATSYVKEVGPLIQTAWNQDAPWNDLTPQCAAESSNPNDYYQERMPLGCVATMYSQIMKYYEWPKFVDEDYSKTLRTSGGALEKDYEMKVRGGTLLEWEKMTNTYAWKNTAERQRLPIARLGLLTGIMVNMSYAPTGSSASTGRPNVWYESTQSGRKELTTQELRAIKASLEAKMPLPTVIPNHAIITDGYAETAKGETFLHLNYGWGGSNTRYYALDVAQLEWWDCGYAPKVQIQVASLPEMITNGQVLTWDLPAFQQHKYRGMRITASTDTDMSMPQTWPSSMDVSVDEDDGINVVKERYNGNLTSVFKLPSADAYKSEGITYTFSDIFVPSSTSQLRYISKAHWTNDERFEVQVCNVKSQTWETLKTVSPAAKFSGDWEQVEISLAAYAGRSCKLRLRHNHNAGNGYYPSGHYAIGQLALSDVQLYEKNSKTWEVGVTERQHSLTGLEIGKDYLIEMEALTESGSLKKEQMFVTVVAEASESPVIESVKRVTGEMLVDDTLLNCALIGMSGLRVVCNEATTQLKVYSSCPTLLPEDAIEVHKGQGNEFVVLLKSPQTIAGLDGSRLILTLEAWNAQGGKSLRDIVVALRSNVNAIDLNAILLEYVVENGAVTIMGILIPSMVSELEIPAQINGYKVTAIANGAFEDCSFLTTVTLPQTITSIGERAFAKCIGLQSIVIPKGVKQIADETFESCSQLTSISLPEGVVSIGENAFKGCSNLKALEVPTSLHSIAAGAFDGCENLYTDENGFQYESEAKRVLISVPALGETPLEIPESVRVIVASAFESYAEAYWDSNGIQYESEALEVLVDASRCTSTAVEIPESVQYIFPFAFANAGEIEELTILAPVQTFGEFAFAKLAPKKLCAAFVPEGLSVKNLEVLVVPEGVETIQAEAFQGCTQVKTLELPTSLKTIEENAFEDVAPTSVTASYWPKGISVTRLERFNFPEGVSEIHDSAFEHCHYWTELALPEGLAKIGNNAFRNCDNLMKVTLPSTLATVNAYAFDGCGKIQVVAFNGEPPTRVGQKAFPNVKGWYLPVYSEVWEAKLDASGLWHGLKMGLPEFKLTFDAAGGLGGTTMTQVVERTIVPPNVSREGYTFMGWSPEVPLKMPMQDMTHIAQWKVNQYVVTFDANGGEGGWSVGLDYDYPLRAPTVTREGYTFKGWSPEVPQTVPAQEVTYTAQWEIKQYTATFNANDGIGGKVVTSGYGVKLEPPTVTRKGYSFIGWSPAVPSEMPAKDTAYTALWKINQYVVTFDANGGEGGWSVGLDYGYPLRAPTVTREGYTFKGWSPEVPQTVPAQEVTYTAQWEIKQYTATFNANGGIGGKTVTQDYGSALIAPIVTRTGYTFVGWSPAVPPKMPAKNTAYTAQWKVDDSASDEPDEVLYTITFNANGGIGGKIVKQASGTALIAPIVKREGYTFLGWSPAVPMLTPAINVTYTAQWQKNLDHEDSSEMDTVDIKYLTYVIKQNSAMITGCKVDVVGHLIIPPRCEGFVVNAIADGAFKDKKQLLKITFPEALTSIGKDAFAGCSNLDVNAIVMPNQPKLKVGKGAFTGCKVTEVSAVPGEPLTSKQLGKAVVGYKAATTASGLKVNAKTGDITATFKKSGIYEAVLFKPGATLKAIRIKVGDMPKLTIKMEDANTGCSVKGAGSYLMGKKVSLSAKASKEKIFVGFYENGKLITNAMKYSFVMGRENRTLTAKFKEEIITINTSALTSKTWKVGETVNVTIPVTAESGVKSVKAKLPTGLKLAKTKDGKWQVTGSPKKMGAYTVTFTVGTVQKKQKIVTFAMKVEAESVTINTAAVKNKTLNVGQATSGLTIGASATSGIKSVKASKLPAGVKVQQIDGVWQLTGAPKKAGMYNVTLTIMTKAGSKVTETFTLTVALIPEWAAKTFSGEVINGWEEVWGWETEVGVATITVANNGFVSGFVEFADGARASVAATAKLLDSTTAKLRLQVLVEWFDSFGDPDGKVKTELIIRKDSNGTVLLDYCDSTKGSYVKGTLGVIVK